MNTLDTVNENEHENSVHQKNKVWLFVLVAVIVLLMLSSYLLFNNYWDPSESANTFSH